MSVKARFNRTMLVASALSWVLVTLMPVINAHGNSAGVWATLCTINGFEWVQVEEGKTDSPSHSKPCPFSHFSSFHQDTFPTTHPTRQTVCVSLERYTYLALSVRFERHIPRAPPAIMSVS